MATFKYSEPWKKDIVEAHIIEAVMYVPATPGGELRMMLIKMEEKIAFPGRVKYMDNVGYTIKDIMANKDPWKNRENCLQCENKPGKCKRPVVVYSLICRKCLQRPHIFKDKLPT